MPPKRERYNAKARSGGGSHSHKKKQVSGGRAEAAAEAARQAEIAAKLENMTASQRRAHELMQEMLAQNAERGGAAVSTKKRKRFEAFVAKQMKKEEHTALLASLAESSADVVDRSLLVSSSTLGTGKARTAADRLQDEKDRRANVKLAHGAPRQAGIYRSVADDLDADLDDSPAPHVAGVHSLVSAPPKIALADRPVGEQLEDPDRRARIEEATRAYARTASASGTPSSASAVAPAAVSRPVGSALAGAPVTRKPKRKPRKRAKRAVPESESDFDSSASSSSESEEAAAIPAPSKGKGKGKATETSVSGPSTEPPDEGEEQEGQTDDEEEEEQDVAIVAELKRRGLDPSDYGFGSSENEAEAPLTSAGQGIRKKSVSFALDSDAEDGRGYGSQTDDEMEEEQDAAIVAELLRRGMDPTQFGFDAPSDIEDGPARDEAASREGSPPWEGFASEDGDVDMSSSSSSSSSSESSSDDEEDSSEAAVAAPTPATKTSRSSGFKAWAQQALASTGTGRPEDAGPDSNGPTEEGRPLEPVMGLKVRVGDTLPGDGRAHGPLGASEGQDEPLSAFGQAHYAEASRFPTNNVLVPRTDAEQEARLKLPVVGDEDSIVKTILENPVTVLCGETGSGKTTQVPQFLYERGFGTPGSQNPGMIGVTQPRRVAAVSMANRVQVELGTEHGKLVGYQVRYEGRASDATALKFMTDGVLLRELATDFLLSRYSVIVIDEAHERSVNTDILIGLLTRIVRLREKQWIAHTRGATNAPAKKQKDAPRPLRLIIMSATLRVQDFVGNKSLFPARVGPPPVLEVQGRQHDVAVHFNKRTSHDFLAEAVKKVSKIHTRLPPGAILVFLTGQQDIVTVVRQLQAKFGPQAIERRQQARAHAAERANAARRRVAEAQTEASSASSDADADAVDAAQAHLTELEAEEVELGDDGAAVLPEVKEEGDGPEDPDALDTDSEAEDEREDQATRVDPRDETEVPMHVLPLYSLLAPEAQMRVFEPPPEGSRLVVVATNVAETSLTIPGVRYVVDCGRAKERTYDAATGVQGYKVNWVSKASAAQRSGRAGRTGPGHCYRLYSAAVFEDHFDLFSPPEIQRTPVEAVVLHMKAMGITKVMNFPFPSPPPEEALERAERQLVLLGALDQATVQSVGQPPLTTITEQGRAMAELPLAPRLAKMVVEGYAHSSLPHVLAIVAAISVGDPFVRPEGLLAPDEETQERPDASKGEADSEDEVPELKSERAQEREARRALRSRYAAAMQALNRAYGAGTSDLMRLLVAVGAYEDEGGSTSFCSDYFLRPKAMEEIHKLRAQLGRIVLQHFAPGGDVARLPDRVVRDVLSPALAKASVAQVTTLRRLVAQAFADQVAVRADQVPDSVPEGDAGSVGAAPKAGKAQLARRIPYRAMGVKEHVYLHPSSDLARNPAPKWVVFTEAVRGANKMRVVDETTEVVEGRTMLRGLTRIEPEWLVGLAPRLLTWDRAANETAPPDQATLARALAAARAAPPGQAPKPVARSISRTPRYAAGPEWAQGLGWPLPPVKVVQHLVHGRWQDAPSDA